MARGRGTDQRAGSDSLFVHNSTASPPRAGPKKSVGDWWTKEDPPAAHPVSIRVCVTGWIRQLLPCLRMLPAKHHTLRSHASVQPVSLWPSTRKRNTEAGKARRREPSQQRVLSLLFPSDTVLIKHDLPQPHQQQSERGSQDSGFRPQQWTRIAMWTTRSISSLGVSSSHRGWTTTSPWRPACAAA